MALTREEKEKIINELRKKIEEQKSIIFVSIKGLKNDELLNLRRELKKNDCLLAVIKKTLIERVFQEKGIPYEKEKMLGQLALVFGFKDELSPVKISEKFSRKNKNLNILGGFFENNLISREDVLNLAKIPSKMELLAKLVSSLNSPISSFASVLQGNIKGLVYVLSQKAKA